MTSDLVDRLAKQFSKKNIEYCFWKSTLFIDLAPSGERDLDLLIERKSMPQAESILHDLGFRVVTKQWGKMPPGIHHYFGYDQNYRKFIHVHIFSQLQTGESLVKSHNFPIENMVLLNNFTSSVGIRQLPKTAELIVFFLRYFVKFGSLPDMFFLLKWYDLFKEEINWLLSDVDLKEAYELLSKYCPVIPEELFLECIDAFRTPDDRVRLYLLSRKVRRRLSVYKVYSRTQTIVGYLDWMRAKLFRRFTINKHNKILRSGGMVIAFIGGDGVGKSTLTSTCQKWLKALFPTRLVHAGKPPSSIFTVPINLSLLLARKIKPQKTPSRREENPENQDQEDKGSKKISLFSLLYAFRSVTLAWDRQRLLTRSRRRAAHGEIVICDRYPSLQVGAMDSPRLAEIETGTGLIWSIYNKLARTEMSLYKKIPPPDIVLRLNVSVETAKKRNLEREKSFKEEDDYLEARHELVKLWSSPAAHKIYDIDTDQSLEDTIQDVKKAIWESL